MTTDPIPGPRALHLRSPLIVAACLIVFAEPIREPDFVPDTEGAHLAEVPTSLDDAIQTAIREGRLTDAKALLRTRLSQGASSCVPYRLAVELALRNGELPRQTRGWEEELRESQSPFLLWAYAAALSEQGEDGRALNVLSRVMELRVPCLDAYRRFVRVSQRHGTLDEAESRLRQLVQKRPSDPYLLHAVALLADTRGEGEEATAAFLDSVLRASPLPQSYFGLSALLTRAGELNRALDLSQRGSALARALGYSEIELDFMIQQAELFAWLGEDGRSEEIFERAIEKARLERDRAAEIRILLERSALASALGDPASARAFFERVEEIPEEGPTNRARAQILLRKGEVLIAIGRRSRARTNFETSIVLAREARDPVIELDALLGLVHVGIREGSSADALGMTRAALEKAVDLQDGRRQAASLMAAAALYESMGRFERALELLDQVLERARRDADRTREVLTLSNLSVVHLRLGLPEPAVRFAEQARERSRDLRDWRVQLGVAQSLAAALAGAGRYEEAERVFRVAYLESERLADVELKGLIAAGLGRVLLALGRAREAQEVFERALDLARGTRSSLVALQSRSGLGLALRQQGRLAAALEELEASLTQVESSRSSLVDEANRIRYAETRAQIYSNLTAVLVELDRAQPAAGYGERAFSVNERSRSRALLDIVSRAIPDARSSLLSRQPLSSLEIRERTLRPGELLLEFALGERESTLWAISSNDLQRYALPARDEIEENVRLFLEAVRTPPRALSKPFDNHLAHGLRLYRMLIAPAEELVERASHVIVSPHGALNLLPFEALPRELSDGSTSYWVEHSVVSYSPSASALGYLRERSQRSASPPLVFLGIAQPRPAILRNARQELYPSIPFASLEIESIASLFSAQERRIYLGPETTEDAVKRESLSRYRILHFAAHAEVDALTPERSAIVLGTREGSGEDGLLSMEEVLGLELSSELVVLSGCETGLGQVLEAEGTLGLTWAFLSAGSSAVAVSLWNVNDRSTSTVMEAFYRGLAERRSSAESLAEAKRAMLRSTRRAYRHPFYWAPFVLVGAGSD